MRHFFEVLFLVIFVHSCAAIEHDFLPDYLQTGQQSPNLAIDQPKRYIQSCDEASSSGVYDLRLSSKSLPFQGFCDVESLFGKWLVFQQRLDGSVDFNRSWVEYQNGFGQVGESTEYWLGLELLNQITTSVQFELAIELRNEEGKYGFARYDLFEVAGKGEHYKIHPGNNKGTISDNLPLNKFQTYDKYSYTGCSEQLIGGWWFSIGCKSFLNGPYMPNPNTGKGIHWDGWTDAATFSRMMIRRKS